MSVKPEESVAEFTLKAVAAGGLVAGLVVADALPKSVDPRIPGLAGEVIAVMAVLLLCVFLYGAGRIGTASRPRS